LQVLRFQKRRILVANDNEDSADSMARMLRIMGHEVTHAPG
jgi:CheY-like chemotaxis protein